MSELISQREYARRRGVSHAAVQKAIKAGRVKAIDGKISQVQADRDWRLNTDETKSSNSVSGNPKHRRAPDSPPMPAEPAKKTQTAAPPPSSPPLPPAQIPQESMSSGPSYSQARAIRESYLARLAKLEYDEKAGKLISADEVRVSSFNVARTARDALMAISSRVSSILAGIADDREIERVLNDEIRRVCMELSKTSSAARV